MDPRSDVFTLRARPARFVLLLLWSPVVVGIASCPQHLPDCFCCCGPSPQLFLLVLLVRASLHLLPIFAALVFFLPFLIISSFNSFFFLKRFLLPHRFLCQLLCILPIFAFSGSPLMYEYMRECMRIRICFFIQYRFHSFILHVHLLPSSPALCLPTRVPIHQENYCRWYFPEKKLAGLSATYLFQIATQNPSWCIRLRRHPKEKLYEFSTVNTCRRAKKEWSSKFQRPWPTINHKAYVASTCTHTGCLWMLEAPWGPAGRRRAAGAAPNYPEIIPIIQVVRAVCRIIQVQRGRDDISGQPGCAAPAQNHSWCILTLSSFWFQIFWTFCLVSPLVTCSTQLKATGSQK